jgi:outer membrane protein OmpU
MNKLTKIGVSALCGSLASVTAAHAGALDVTGGATATWVSNEATNTGNPIGLSSGILFTGTGELDNGTAITLTLSNTDQSAYSAGSIALATPNWGTFTIDQGAGGSGIDRYDDMMPTAWEETNGAGLGMGFNTVGGVSGSANIDWKVPASLLPEGLGVAVAWTPKDSGLGANDKATDTGGEQNGGGWDLALEHTALVDGLKVFGGISIIENNSLNGDDREQTVLGATYATGMVTVGYQISRDEKNGSATSVNFYENEAWGVSFAINDDLSISYGEHSSDKSVETSATVDVETTGKSLQVSYTMGGASIKLAQNSVDNATYVSTTTADRDGTTVALSLAF